MSKLSAIGDAIISVASTTVGLILLLMKRWMKKRPGSMRDLATMFTKLF